ncbi:hypothetical protein AURDEDRAFT_129381 [Auricularia subglabra TFB-10046 SS5]|nr:hypothetical protein AURDEDRAFT_129381 [Auricularia subglabra TFB-10046 SS5]
MLPRKAAKKVHFDVSAGYQAAPRNVPKPLESSQTTTRMAKVPQARSALSATTAAHGSNMDPPWQLMLNPLLRPHGDLIHNFVNQPSTARSKDGILKPWQLEQYVTKMPEIVRMDIAVEFPYSDCDTVHMRPTGIFTIVSPVGYKPLTIGELIWGIHGWLHGAIELQEWERVTHARRDIATRAFYGRTARDPEEKQRGLRRIDWFGENTFFGGIVPVDRSAETWRLALIADHQDGGAPKSLMPLREERMHSSSLTTCALLIVYIPVISRYHM